MKLGCCPEPREQHIHGAHAERRQCQGSIFLMLFTNLFPAK